MFKLFVKKIQKEGLQANMDLGDAGVVSHLDSEEM